MHEKFIARQPIFDDKLKVFGYELLFRASSENVFRPYKSASDSLIVDSTSLFGLQSLTGHAKAFVNLDLFALQRGTARLLPPDQVVIEILESITPTQEVVQLCAELCNEGYALALDDYVGHPKWEPLVPLVKFLKVDFRACDPPTRAAIANRHRAQPGPQFGTQTSVDANANSMRLLAEKIESNDDLLEARSLGYTFFQGYFFCKPSTLSVREIPGNKLNCLRLLHLVASPDFSYDAVEELLKTDPALVYKLLRYLNSWLVAIRGEIHSIREAIALLGEKEFRRWISVLAVVAMASDKPHELIRTALTRAFFCENLAKALASAPEPVSTPSNSVAPASSTRVSLSPISVKSSDLFLMGLLSVTDAILDRPMEQVLASLPIAAEVRAALCGTANQYRDVYDVLLAYERADWPTLSTASTRLGIDESAVAACESKAREAASLC